jgi:predicted amidophosphoribosyltransferase
LSCIGFVTIKVAVVTGHAPLRDVALLADFYSTGSTPNEAAKLVVSDYLAEDGSARVDLALRPAIAFADGKAVFR